MESNISDIFSSIFSISSEDAVCCSLWRPRLLAPRPGSATELLMLAGAEQLELEVELVEAQEAVSAMEEYPLSSAAGGSQSSL